MASPTNVFVSKFCFRLTAFAGHYDTAVRIEIVPDVDVNSVANLPNILRKILGRQGSARQSAER